jgi:hypothetical protein
MRSKFFLLLLAMFLVTASGGVAVSASNESKYQARQHGYEHGYRDGFQHGREDQERRVAFKFDTEDYKHGDRGYDKYMGDRDHYKEGYRTGYQAGYNDAYYRRPGRFASIYGPSGSLEYHSYPDDYVFDSRSGGYPDIGYDTGYRDGVQAGTKAQEKHEKFDPADHDRYRDGDHDYRSSFGDKELYKRSYRDGFMRGYQDSYGRWR